METLTAHSSVATAEAEEAFGWTAPPAARSARAEAVYVTDRLHPDVFRLFVGTYGAMLLSLWLLFATDVGAFIALAICTAYFAMYFGTPVLMNRMAEKAAPQPAPESFAQFLRGEVDTYTGRVSGWGAMAQLLVIPAGITFAFICIGVIIKLGA
jgi:hypothetical protein